MSDTRSKTNPASCRVCENTDDEGPLVQVNGEKVPKRVIDHALCAVCPLHEVQLLAQAA